MGEVALREVAPLVVDASAFLEYTLVTPLGQQVESLVEAPESAIHAPVICDIEFVSGLRRMHRAGRISVERADQALLDYASLELTRHAHRQLLYRVFELRDNFAASDATYVALCESLGATLVTCDLRLTRAARQYSDLNVVGVGA